MREYQQYIAGEWVGSSRLFDDLDPYRGTVMARIPAGRRADAARAVDAAAEAFPALGGSASRGEAGHVPARGRHRGTAPGRDHRAPGVGNRLRGRVRRLSGADRRAPAATGCQRGVPARRGGHPVRRPRHVRAGAAQAARRGGRSWSGPRTPPRPASRTASIRSSSVTADPPLHTPAQELTAAGARGLWNAARAAPASCHLYTAGREKPSTASGWTYQGCGARLVTSVNVAMKTCP